MIKKFWQFVKEEVSGTELPTGPGGSFGLAFGETRLQNKTVDFHDTNVILSEVDNKFYTIDEFNDLYNEYLKLGGKPLDGFNRENLDTVIDLIEIKDSNNFNENIKNNLNKSISQEELKKLKDSYYRLK